MKTWTAEAIKLMVALSMTEKEMITDKLANVIEKYRDDPAKSGIMAETIVQFFEKIAYESGGYAAGSNATREDVGILLLEIQKLRNEINELKQNQDNV